jgi:hypothetical protein
MTGPLDEFLAVVYGDEHQKRGPPPKPSARDVIELQQRLIRRLEQENNLLSEQVRSLRRAALHDKGDGE